MEPENKNSVNDMRIITTDQNNNWKNYSSNNLDNSRSYAHEEIRNTQRNQMNRGYSTNFNRANNDSLLRIGVSPPVNLNRQSSRARPYKNKNLNNTTFDFPIGQKHKHFLIFNYTD